MKSHQDFQERLRNPPPRSALERARDFGVDLTLLAARLELTPEARLESLQCFMRDLEAARADARASLRQRER